MGETARKLAAQLDARTKTISEYGPEGSAVAKRISAECKKALGKAKTEADIVKVLRSSIAKADRKVAEFGN